MFQRYSKYVQISIGINAKKKMLLSSFLAPYVYIPEVTGKTST